MATNKQKVDLSQLPLHYQKVGKNWWRNMQTMELIHNDKIHLHLPKVEIEPKQLWQNKYDNY